MLVARLDATLRGPSSEEQFVQAIKTMKRVLNTEHPGTLTSLNNIASTYWDEGQWKEAEELFVTTKRVLGAEHPAMVNSMDNLAHT